jgi:hypothetical protein
VSDIGKVLIPKGTMVKSILKKNIAIVKGRLMQKKSDIELSECKHVSDI